jgi:hypothetical protein
LNNSFPSRELVESVRAQYPVGTHVELVKMDDVQAPPVGTRGTVLGVDDIGSVMVHWDNGSSLHVVYGEDVCMIVGDDIKELQHSITSRGRAGNGVCLYR